MNETNYSEFVSDLQDMVETAYSDVRESLLDKVLRPMVFQAGEVLGMLLKVRPRILSGYCQSVVTCGQ